MRVTSLFLAILLSYAGAGQSQATARQAIDGFTAALNGRNWSEAARFLDLDQFDTFRKDFIDRTREQNEAPMITVEELRKMDPEMPRIVAEYQVKKMREERARYADPTPLEFARVKSTTELARLRSGEAAARWLESRDPEYQIKAQYQAAGCSLPQDDDQIPAVVRRVVGTLEDTDSSSYGLIVEERQDSESSDFVTVVRLHRRGDRWLIEPRPDLLPELDMVDTADCRKSGRQ